MKRLGTSLRAHTAFIPTFIRSLSSTAPCASDVSSVSNPASESSFFTVASDECPVSVSGASDPITVLPVPASMT